MSDEPIPIGPVLAELGADDVPFGLGWVRMRCYAHDDRTASAAVNHELNAYVCHSCERKGDAVKLLMQERRLTHREAFDLARSLTGVVRGAKPARRRRSRPSDLLKGNR